MRKKTTRTNERDGESRRSRDDRRRRRERDHGAATTFLSLSVRNARVPNLERGKFTPRQQNDTPFPGRSAGPVGAGHVVFRALLNARTPRSRTHASAKCSRSVSNAITRSRLASSIESRRARPARALLFPRFDNELFAHHLRHNAPLRRLENRQTRGYVRSQRGVRRPTTRSRRARRAIPPSSRLPRGRFAVRVARRRASSGTAEPFR